MRTVLTCSLDWRGDSHRSATLQKWQEGFVAVELLDLDLEECTEVS
ncbi:MAG TPA: hypothetical protein VFE41_27185 [Acetobacteraceae bacterium]|jgi:hypothetical protein|nr:hypothetical protein [Acetobacteraceae bacterium]HTC12460.1 hypothetical protein [Acetobacteraceae bacterium]